MTKRKKTERKNLILRICVFAFIVYAAITLVDMQVEITAARQRLDSVNESIRIQRMVNNDLKRQVNQIKDGTDDATIERIAREKLDFVWPDEKVFFDISGS